MKITVREHEIIVEDDDGWLTEADKAAIVQHLESRRGAIAQQFEAMFFGSDGQTAKMAKQ